MSLVSSIRQWVIKFLLHFAFTVKNTTIARGTVHLLQFLLPFDKRWVRSDSRGIWIADNVANAKKEAIADCVASSDVILFWIPGGSFRFDLKYLYVGTFKTWMRALEATQGRKCIIFIPNYRYAPEHRFPAAVKDITEAYHWLTDTMRVPPRKLLLGADSAGAAIALDTLFLQRIQFGGCILVSPYTGLEPGGKFWRRKCSSDYLSVAAIQRMEKSYMPPTGEQPFKYLADKADLAACLPQRMLIMMGGDEALLDDAGYLASQARNGGIQVTVVQLPKQVHLSLLLGPRMIGKTEIWQYALERWVDFVSYQRI